MLLLRPDTELARARKELFEHRTGNVRVVGADVEQVDGLVILAVKPRHVRNRTRSLDHHGNAVKFVVAGVKDETSHGSC